ncbi:helix-turn-helix domain-containing protein [Bacillus sp. RC51]|uniref:helix-turn-helix domain-containing protein n=1 Tax=Bacillus sp. RC51 TaxID=3156288 RepID=UPI003837490F
MSNLYNDLYALQPTDKRQWVRDNVMTTPEAIEYLEISRARMSHMIKNGKIVPLKKLGCVSLFLQEDLEKKKEELIEARMKYRPYEY